MITSLAILTCNRGNDALKRHWPYFLRQEADYNYVITTENTHCEVPEGGHEIKVGVDNYINGSHLPLRLINTLKHLLGTHSEIIIVTEYDTVIFNRIKVENIRKDAAGHLAGNYAQDYGFYHNPWVFTRGSARRFADEGVKAVNEGICAEGRYESSPDVFFGIVCYRAGLQVHTDLWKEFSRNSLDRHGDKDLAKRAYRSGVDVIHGIKTKDELDFITSRPQS